VRKDQDLSAEADRLDKNIITAVSKPPAERNPSAEDQIRKRIDDIKSERDKLQDVFNQRFPDYVALSKPQPLSVEQTQALLADDEALAVCIDLVGRPAGEDRVGSIGVVQQGLRTPTELTALATCAALTPTAAITVTCRRTRSAASAAWWPTSFPEASMVTLRPAT
jgi:hypothetical protein